MATLTVTVLEEKVTGVSLSNSSIDIAIGYGVTFKPIIQPSTAYNKKVTWTSSNPSVATVSADGSVKGISEGTTVITVTTNDGGYTAKCIVNVNVIKVTGVDIVCDKRLPMNVNVGDTFQLRAQIEPYKATNKNVTWTSSNPEIATVTQNGYVKVLKSGERVHILVTTEDGGYFDRWTFNVQNN